MYCYICWRSVRNGLLVLLGALPLYLIRLEVLSIPTTLLELMVGVVFVFWVTRMLASRLVIASGSEATSISNAQDSSLSRLLPFVAMTRAIARMPKLNLVLLGTILIIIGAFLGLTQTADLASSLNAVKSFLIEPLLVAIMIWSVTRDEKKFQIKDWMFALAVPMSILSIYAIFQWLTGFGIPDAWFLERRVTSFFPYPNALGHFVAPIVTLLIVWFMQRGLRRLGARDILLLATIPFGLITLLLSQTEAAWIAIAATILIAGIVTNKNRKAWIAIGILGAIFAIAIPQARHKLMLNDWSGQTRTAQWEETANFLSASQQNFFLGAGPNNYPNAIAPFHTHDYLEVFQQPHNIFLNAWVEYGILGLAGFLILASILVNTIMATPARRDALLRVRSSKPQPVGTGRDLSASSITSKASIPLAAALLEMSIHGLVDVPYFKNDLSILTWALVALLLISSYDRD